ncbi:ABC transporter ATP-binding protein [Pectinatus frisingensis]|uniref:ABC transporter ATP-binding protein n=1 Tax=Pectinatus frisingensis TaxID=865 RepID=UPI0018C77374|nr:ABC transporter ATP-binding protein [Pectinatus frisingensis]
MNAVEFEHVKKQFPRMGYMTLDDVNVQINEGEFVTILGSSGCGKTTFIKMINRLYKPDFGHIRLFGKDIQNSNPVLLRRKIGYVIQQVGLFPHMTVAENIATIPRILKWDKTKIENGIEEMLQLVSLDPKEFRDRYPAQLSGGQQQRVGLARALVANPPIMLLDEPFGAIDAINRENLQNEIKRIHAQSRKTYIFVTHDIREALKLGTKVIIMNKGHIIQYASPKEIINNPCDNFVIDLLKTLNIQNNYVIDGAGI